MKKPFSIRWVFAAILIYTAMEILIAMLVSPALIAGKIASRPLQLRMEMLLHLSSFVVGGFMVGIISPGVRLVEPAVGAFCAVAVSFLMSFFMPIWFYNWDTQKVIIGGGIALVLALIGAYSGEKLMGNVEADAKSPDKRAQLRAQMWGEQGLLVPKNNESNTLL